uniref:Uncharacterized protein n=1 Tax=Arundo donax TaxID=35708 RepID=A0A0A9ETM8_ARUDO
MITSLQGTSTRSRDPFSSCISSLLLLLRLCSCVLGFVTASLSLSHFDRCYFFVFWRDVRSSWLVVCVFIWI